MTGTKKWFHQAALKKLEYLGVRVRLDSKIVEVIDQSIILENGQQVDFDLLIWTAGVSANKIVSEMVGVGPVEKNQCLAVDRGLALIGYPNVFAIGDNTFCFDYERSCPVPPTAQNAIAQGRVSADNIGRVLKGKKKKEFKPKQPNFVIPIGKGYALAEVLGIPVRGKLAWWIKRFVALRYFLTILPFAKALKIWISGVKVFVD